MNRAHKRPTGATLGEAAAVYRPALDPEQNRLLADYRRRQERLAAERSAPGVPPVQRETRPRARSGEHSPLNPGRIACAEPEQPWEAELRRAAGVR